MAHSCNQHNNCIVDALSKAQLICNDRNLNLTPQRKRILEIIWGQGHNSIKAYDILEELQKKDPSAKPTTVYRALEFLIENSIIHKIESKNSFVGCNHPTLQHNCTFLICNKCDDVVECCNNDEIANSIKSNIKHTNFHVETITLEINGTCTNCY